MIADQLLSRARITSNRLASREGCEVHIYEDKARCVKYEHGELLVERALYVRRAGEDVPSGAELLEVVNAGARAPSGAGGAL